MITVTIGTASREWSRPDDVEGSWIAQHITERQRAGEPVCVYVRINFPGINAHMNAGACSQALGGSPRVPNAQERQILDLWDARVRSNGYVNPGEIRSFFAQLDRLI